MDEQSPWADVNKTDDWWKRISNSSGATTNSVRSKAWQSLSMGSTTIPATSLISILSSAHLNSDQILRISTIAVKGDKVNQSEFNMALQLLALCQNGYEISLENLEIHKNILEPVLDIPVHPFQPTSFPSNINHEAENIISNQLSLGLKNMEELKLNIEDPDFNPYSSNQESLSANISQYLPPEKNTHSSHEERASMSPTLIETASEITVELVPEKVGVIFKHVNYFISSKKYGVKVTRRYSDFDWLIDILVKRYPFRILPTLPPKRLVGGASDNTFLERRRKGLSRFSNMIANHPVLKLDETFISFITIAEDVKFANYKKSVNPDVDEEFLMGNVSPSLLATIPSNLESSIEDFKKNLDSTIQKLLVAITMMERLCQRAIGNSLDLKKLIDVIENSKSTVVLDCCYEAGGCHKCLEVNNGMSTISQFFLSFCDLYEQQARAGFEGIVQDMKQRRELYSSFSELLLRRDRLILNDLESVQKRIIVNQNKLNSHRLKNGSSSNNNLADKEITKLESLVNEDLKFMELNTKRNDHMRLSLWQEFEYLHANKACIGIIFSEKYSELWKRLLTLVNEVPTNGFMK